MTIATLSKQLGLGSVEQEPIKEVLPELLSAVQAASSDLFKSIKNDTVTVDQIDSFLEHHLGLLPAHKRQDVQEVLLSKKATVLLSHGRMEEALEGYDRALSVKETPSTWASKGMALLRLERLDDTFDAFQKSYSLRQEFGPQKQAHLENLLGAWSVAALLRGLSGILDENLSEAEKGAFEYIELLNRAEEDNLAGLVLNLAVERPVPDNTKAGLEELELMVRLLSIKDPFEGWREFGKEISKVWPRGLSAVDAIREQRDREWNQ